MRPAILACLLVAIPLVPTATNAQINVPHVFLGFTTATFDGGQGIFTYHAACAAEFPNSRMCTSQEILTSPTTPTGLAGDAWVQPSFVPGVQSADACGVESSSSVFFTCRGWSFSASGSGLTVDASGRFGGVGVAICDVARSISCCGPPISVSQGDLNQDGVVNLVDEVILRRMLAGLPVFVS